MCGNEVFQYVKTFSEVGLDRKLDGTSGCIRHKSSHTCKLLDLLIRTSGTGISHHEDVVILIKTAKQRIFDLIIGYLPYLDYFFVSFFVSDKTTSEVSCNFIYLLFCISQIFCLFCRHCHI